MSSLKRHVFISLLFILKYPQVQRLFSHCAIILSSRKDILRTIYPIDLQFSVFVPLDKFGVISRAIFHMICVLMK